MSSRIAWIAAAAVTGALVAGGLAGCAGTVPPVAPGASRPPAPALARRRFDDPALLRFLAAQTGEPQAAQQPWNAGRLALAALYFHPDVRLARADVDLARADLQIARQWPNPDLQLGLKFTVGGAAAAAAPSPWTVGAAIGLLLVSRDRREAQVAQAQAGVRAARLLLATAQRSVGARVQDAFVALWRSQQDETWLARELQARRDVERRTVLRERAGWESPLAAAQAEQAARATALALERAQGTAGRARAALAAAVGVPESALSAVALDFSAFGAPPRQPDAAQLAGWKQSALVDRPDVRAAWERVGQARAALELAQAERYGAPPQVAPGFTTDQDQNRATAAATLPLPVFNQHQGQIAAARARLDQADARLQQTQAAALAGFEQARLRLRTAQAADHRAQELLAADRERALQAGRALGEGWLGPLPAELARLQALVSARTAAQARADDWQAFADLRTAAGIPSPRP